MRFFFLKLFVLLLIVNTANAQSKRREQYDSLLVGDLITPAVSSVMMPRTYTEIILSNSLLSTNSFYTDDRETYKMNSRSTYFINTLQVTRGISASGRFNVGLDVSYRTARSDADPDSSPMKVFGNSSEGLIEYGRGITTIGFRARYVPTKDRNFVIQNTFHVPVSPSSDESVFLGDNRYDFNTQFLYTKLIGRKVFLFGQADVLIRFKDDNNDTDYTNPINLYATYLVNRHFFPFVQAGMLNSWGEVNRQSFSYGVGFQYQFHTMFNINAYYSDLFAGKNSNQWKGYNLGIRVVL